MRKKWTTRNKNGELVSVGNRPRCVVCGADASYIVDIEVNWFRGDDEVVKSCETHKNDAEALLAGRAAGVEVQDADV
jgi:hypothetical protein